jgi:hypothetical protein
MTIVTLIDGTTYYVDTDNSNSVYGVVEYKLQDRNDYRTVEKTEVFDGITISKDTKYYNSDDSYDGIPLQAKTGWSYKWGIKGTHFTRN